MIVKQEKSASPLALFNLQHQVNMEALKCMVVVSIFVPLVLSQSREYTEVDVPGNLTLLDVVDRYAHIGWDPVPRESMMDCYARYIVNIWSEDGNDTFLIIPEITSTEIPYFPGVVNNVTVSISSCNSVGPPSDMISFLAPEAEPPKPEFLNIHQLGNDSVLVTWYQPRIRTGKLLGYHLFYGDLSKMFTMENANHHEVFDMDHEQAKLADLNEEATYKVGVYSVNTAGSSKINYKEFRVESHSPQKPGKPTFAWKLNYTEREIEDLYDKFSENIDPTQPSLDHLLKISTTMKPKAPISRMVTSMNNKDSQQHCMTSLKIIWHPSLDEHPGDYFKVKMKNTDEEEFQTVWTQYSEDYVVTNRYDACKTHEVIVTSVDGEFETDSDMQEIPALEE